jgi:hypothetical protein
MIIFCEECGEKYIIEPDEIKGTALIFICRVCNDIIKVPTQESSKSKPVTADKKKD